MERLKEIFWKYFVERRRGKIRVFFKEPKPDDKLGMKLFGLMNVTGFLICLIMTVIFIYVLFIAHLLGGIDIVWPILVIAVYVFIGIYGILIIFYYVHLQSYLYAVIYFIALILSFFVYRFLMGGRI